MKGVRHGDELDIVVVRENTEGEYSGLEHEVVDGVVESLKVITEEKSLRTAEYAFEFAFLNNRRRVTAVHKANIMKKGDGMFLKACKSVAARFPTIEYSEMIVDNTCMQLVSKPEQFDVMVRAREERERGGAGGGELGGARDGGTRAPFLLLLAPKH